MLPDAACCLTASIHLTRTQVCNYKFHWTLISQKIYTLNPLVVYIYIHLHRGNQSKNKNIIISPKKNQHHGYSRSFTIRPTQYA